MKKLLIIFYSVLCFITLCKMLLGIMEVNGLVSQDVEVTTNPSILMKVGD